MFEFDDDDFEYYIKDYNKAAERLNWKAQVQEELEELGEFYDVDFENVRL